MYADNTCITVTAKTQDELKQKTEKVIEEYLQWCNINKMIPNMTKTNYLAYSIKNKEKQNLEITVNNEQIEEKKRFETLE